MQTLEVKYRRVSWHYLTPRSFGVFVEEVKEGLDELFKKKKKKKVILQTELVISFNLKFDLNYKQPLKSCFVQVNIFFMRKNF